MSDCRRAFHLDATCVESARTKCLPAGHMGASVLSGTSHAECPADRRSPMRGSRRLTTIIGTLAFGLIGGVAQATLLTFEGNICGGGPCGNGAPIDQSYGDAAGMVDVTYTDRVSGGASAPVEPFLRYWANDYNDLQNVAYGGSPGGVAEIRLTPAGGFQVTLNSFDLGAWPDATRPSQYTIYDSSESCSLQLGCDPRRERRHHAFALHAWPDEFGRSDPSVGTGLLQCRHRQSRLHRGPNEH